MKREKHFIAAVLLMAKSLFVWVKRHSHRLEYTYLEGEEDADQTIWSQTKNSD